jgi:hypothetical protein
MGEQFQGTIPADLDERPEIPAESLFRIEQAIKAMDSAGLEESRMTPKTQRHITGRKIKSIMAPIFLDTRKVTVDNAPKHPEKQ